MKKIVHRLDGYRRRSLYEWNRWRNAVAAEKRAACFSRWMHQIKQNPPEVLVGANFAAFGGVRQHLHAIRKYSELHVELVPSEEVMRILSAHHFVHDFGEQFKKIPLRGVRAIHSHVFPWFTDWCQKRQSRSTLWVHTYHNHYFSEFGKDGKLEPWQEEFNESFLNVAPKANVRLSVSRWQSEQLLCEYGIKTEYLPNGVDVLGCDAGCAERFLKAVGSEDFILYVGRNDPVKNPAEFVQLAKVLPERRFIMIGGGLSRDTLRDEWHIEPPPNLLILGSLSHAKVQDAIAACSALVVTSKREGLPTLVMEGMTHRKAVVVPNERGCVEVVDHGRYGYVYRLGDIDDLAHQTLKAMEDTKMGDQARNRVLQEYDWRVIAPRLDAIYRGEVLE